MDNIKTFEETIKDTLTGETQKNALNFTAFMAANGITTGENHGTVVYNGKVLAWMHMDGKTDLPGPWTVWPDLIGTVPDGFDFDDAMKEIAWKNVNICASCGSDCAPEVTRRSSVRILKMSAVRYWRLQTPMPKRLNV